MERVASVLPTMTQLAGSAAVGAGVYLLWGVAWTLLIVGVLVVMVGAAAEGGWI